MKNLSLWAQSLDNESPDFIYKDGEELLDEELRQQFVSDIYEFTDKKLEKFPSESSISIRYSESKFVMEAIPSQKDQANRLAPVLIYGKFPDKSSSEWVDDVCNEINIVIKDKLGRTLDGNTLKYIKKELTETLEQKKKKREALNLSVILILIIFGALFLIFLIWFIQQRQK